MRHTIPCSLVVLFLLAPIIARADSPATQPAITQPAQPASGPGGADYQHRSLTAFSYGHGDTQFWMFEPAEPVPESAPVIVFMHGWAAMDPCLYGGWIKHLVRHGNIVIFPRYQSGLVTPGATFIPNAADAVSAALAELKKPGHVKPDLERFYMVSHSMGGPIIATLAATYEDRKLPKPRALMIVEPGGSNVAHLPDLARIAPDTLVVVVSGHDDRVVGPEPAELFRRISGVPADHKVFLTVVADDHGQPTVQAGHLFPMCIDHDLDATRIPDHETMKTPSGWPSRKRPSELELQLMSIDASDYFGLWKTFDLLRDLSVRGSDLSPAHTNTKEFRSMGMWSDGTAIRPLVVSREP